MTTATATEQRFDADTLAFVERDLVVRKQQIYKKRYPEKKMAAGRIIPIDVDTSLEWADEVEVEEYESLGMNTLIADYSKGGPRVDVLYRRVRYPIKTHGNHAGWSWEEINKARAFNRPLQQQKLTATRDAYETYVNKTGYEGDPDAGIPGLLTVPMQRAIASVPISAASTVDNILASLGAYVALLVDSTNGLAVPKRLIMPFNKHHYLFNTYRAGTDTSIGEAFLKSQRELGYITEIVADNALKGKGTNGSDVMFILPIDPDVISLSIPMPYRILPEQQQNLEIVVHTVGRIGGVHCKKPMEMLAVEAI